jgi:hypothetical protein
MAIGTLEAKFEDRRPNPQTLEIKNPKDLKDGDNVIPTATNNQSGSAAAASAQARALPDKEKEAEVSGKDKQDKSQGQGLIDLILTKLGFNAFEKDNVIGDTSVQKNSSAQTIEASAARVAPEKMGGILPQADIARIAQEQANLQAAGAKMQQENTTSLAYQGARAPQQQTAASLSA